MAYGLPKIYDNVIYRLVNKRRLLALHINKRHSRISTSTQQAHDKIMIRVQIGIGLLDAIFYNEKSILLMR